ncbi:MAG: hypothetical protein ACLR6J_17750 [Parabacteroides merdae]
MKITGGVVYWNQSMLWFRERQKDWNDCEYMIKDWVNWKWLSGDHIVEQHAHNIAMYSHGSKRLENRLKPSVSRFLANAAVSRATSAITSSIDFHEWKTASTCIVCRQIDGCATNVSEFIQGTKGSWNSAEMEIKDNAGNVIWKYDGEAEKNAHTQTNPYVLEHAKLDQTASVAGKPIERAWLAVANMAAIMGRVNQHTPVQKRHGMQRLLLLRLYSERPELRQDGYEWIYSSGSRKTS